MREGKNSGLSLLAALQMLLCFQKIQSTSYMFEGLFREIMGKKKCLGVQS